MSAFRFATVRVGANQTVHLGRSYNDGATFTVRCGWHQAQPVEADITCINCLTRYPGDLYLFRAGRVPFTVRIP
jgi:hypothetical protein